MVFKPVFQNLIMRKPSAFAFALVFIYTLIFLLERAKSVWAKDGTLYFLMDDADAELLIERNRKFILGEMNARAKI